MALGVGQLLLGGALLKPLFADGGPISVSDFPTQDNGGLGAVGEMMVTAAQAFTGPKGYGGPQYDWVEELISHPQIRIVGAQGAGKSTFVRWLAEQRIARGDTVKVVDPHAEYGAWEGLNVIGKGMNFDETARFMREFIQEVEDRYDARAKEANPDLSPGTVICEEMTNWDQKIEPKLIAQFDGTLVADIRKVRFRVIKLAHDDTLSATGGKAGTKKAQNQYLQLTLDRKSDRNSIDGVSPAFTGTLTTMGREPQKVKINPNWKPSRLGSRPVQPGSSPVQPGSTAVQPNPVNQPEPSLNLDDPWLNPPERIDLGNLEPYELQARNLEKSLDLEGAGIDERVRKLHARGHSQADIIFAVWGATKGGTQAYKNARKQYRRILNLGDTDDEQ
jgi:hypothetical protein